MRLSTREITGTIFCAALYAVGSFLTAYVQSPWGLGQFRPAIVIPAVFSIVFGALPAGIGSAIGTLICDSVKHGQLYIPSLVSAVPGNFIGFYMLGKMLKGKFSWQRFVVAGIVTLVVSNVITAFLYVPANYFLGAIPASLTISDLVILATALTVWWFVTMLPFMLLVTPPIIKAVSAAIPSFVPEDVRVVSLRSELPQPLFAKSLILPGVGLIAIWLLLSFTSLGQILLYGLAIKLKSGAAISLEAMDALFLISGIVLSVIGALVYIRLPKTKFVASVEGQAKPKKA